MAITRYTKLIYVILLAQWFVKNEFLYRKQFESRVIQKTGLYMH